MLSRGMRGNMTSRRALDVYIDAHCKRGATTHVKLYRAARRRSGYAYWQINMRASAACAA